MQSEKWRMEKGSWGRGKRMPAPYVILNGVHIVISNMDGTKNPVIVSLIICPHLQIKPRSLSITDKLSATVHGVLHYAENCCRNYRLRSE